MKRLLVAALLVSAAPGGTPFTVDFSTVPNWLALPPTTAANNCAQANTTGDAAQHSTARNGEPPTSRIDVNPASSVILACFTAAKPRPWAPLLAPSLASPL